MSLVKYNAPSWFAKLNQAKIPLYKYELINRPTPIQKIDLLNPAYEIYMKRDDQTHNELQLQGNKLRKLEFLFADALVNHKAKHILTAGGLQSNHCRTVASLANKFNLKTHLFLRSHTSNVNELNLNGNLLVNQLLGANIFLIEKKAQYLTDIEFRMNLLEQKIKEKYNEPCYKIPIGGSNTVGVFGYLEAFNELLAQEADKFIDDIIITTGSGGTMSGLAIANYLTGSRFRIHAFCVCDNRKYFLNHLSEQFHDLFGYECDSVDKLVNIIECSRGIGYAQSTQDELDFLQMFFRLNNILLDPVYTNKTIYTLYNILNGYKPTFAYERDDLAGNLKRNLKGNRLLIFHTGGQLGLFDSGKFDLLFRNEQQNNTSNIFNCFGDNIANIDV